MLHTNKSSEKFAFDTHLNYITSLSLLSVDLSLEYTNKIHQKPIPSYEKKKNIINLTARSLKDEYEIINVDPEYSYASTSWLPVKSYYLIFNLLLTAEYCIRPEEKSFKTSHTRLISNWNHMIKSGEVVFSCEEIGKIHGAEIFDFKLPPGATLSPRTSKENLCKAAMKMIANYKYDEWKSKLKVKLGSKEGQDAKKVFMENFSVSILDYFYQMRIRSNYRDFAFIDEITCEETKKFFETYYSTTIKFQNALVGLCKQLKSERLK